ncbi:cbb3-type cytochrome oxidase subunit 3 [Plasticicumulans acidivorans]|uniref:Cbb3-type cytochrome oxidase component FixQ n=1 Tax=Plasticicumulans acidivorans TaxID=886464 RepID=A0A317MUM4_9GAMM|nr:cbb3-type cytochrome c oxidase subunit 3 [Plasticicumulans acidivorans]PWV61706.1 Cbb3-type cytochrome oxidase component FixQ [Plasticicumulans acidivorans]
MFDWLSWFTRLDNSKIFSLVLFFGAFCGIVIWLFSNRRRGERLESYKNIPFLDDDQPGGSAASSRKVKDNERNDD